MSFVALATDRFDEVVRFYDEGLGLPSVEGWDRSGGRGRRFDLGSLRLEILDNARERQPLRLFDPADRFHLVIEVEDIEAAWSRLAVEAPSPQPTSWGARRFQVRDPDGVPVTFLQWDLSKEDQS
jgi:catechol 2,3-dioxygenase-like lactoylglutathione lyase family enzyme